METEMEPDHLKRFFELGKELQILIFASIVSVD
jgi:hypothetical protein